MITGITVAWPDFVALPKSASGGRGPTAAKWVPTVAQRHLSSAKDNVAQGDWEAANSQCRTFLEALTDAIADRLYPAEAAMRANGLQKRQLLADKGFLSREKHGVRRRENGQTFLPGLAKLLHPDGAHPGVSTQHDAMFRLHIVVVTAHWLLKRLDYELKKMSDLKLFQTKGGTALGELVSSSRAAGAGAADPV